MELSAFGFALYKLVKYLVYPYTWLFILTTLQLVLVVGPGAARRLRAVRVLAVTVFLLVTVLGHPLVSRALTGPLESRYPALTASDRRADAIVALSGGVLPKGTLRPEDDLADESRARTVCAARRYAEGVAPRVVLSGGDAAVFGSGPRESELMKALALRLGVPDAALRLETRSRTTYENAVETKREIGGGAIVLVTSASHMPRAVALFEKQGFTVIASPCSYSIRDHPLIWADLTPFDLIPSVRALQDSTAALNELAGVWVYRATGRL